METFDVVQVGYGPVGQATAALLGRRGHRVALFERQASLYGLPRVGGVDHEIMRTLQSLEVAGEFEARTYPARGSDFLSAAGKTLVHLDWNHTGESGWGLRSLVGWKHAGWEFHLLPGEDREEAATADRCRGRLAPWVTRADGELIRHFVYPFQSLVAADWRRGRALLVGDAAHVMPPTMGQGACTGIRDAASLAWKLDLVLRGLAEDSLLDAYCRERKPHAEAVIIMSVELARAWTDRLSANLDGVTGRTDQQRALATCRCPDGGFRRLAARTWPRGDAA